MSRSFIERIENLPVPILPTFVGALTLSNVFNNLGFSWIRHGTMWVATVIWLVYLMKIIKYPKKFKMEYSNTVLSSLYAGFTMIMMILGSYYIQYNQVVGKGFWAIGLTIHAIHLIIFTYRNVIKNFNKDTFVPSWFVSYNGIMVSVVVSASMNEPLIAKIITYYGMGVYLLILPFMIYRLATVEINPLVYHTQAILLAPASLCVVSYLTAIENPNTALLGLLYVLALCSLAFLLYKIPKFFSMDFTPAYAGMTFPMAIGIVASLQMSGYIGKLGYEQLSAVTKQIAGIQFYITTAIIGYVLIQFLIMGLGTKKKATN